jgi:hypothetical protein
MEEFVPRKAKIVFVRLLMVLGLFNRFGSILVDFTLFNRFERNQGLPNRV